MKVQDSLPTVQEMATHTKEEQVETDPTRIDLDFADRITGRTAIGDLEIDCPVLTEVAHNLYQGGCEDGLYLPEGIDYVVSLYKWEKYRVRKNQTVRGEITVTMYDDPDRPIDSDTVVMLAEWVNKKRKEGPVLVHCQAGLNRSSLIVATALILEGWTAEEAILHLRSERSPAVLCNPAFVRWLHGFEKQNDAERVA